MKRILGLDLGTNSIGWALIEIDHNKGIVRIIQLGTRILPMDAGEIGDFESKGVVKSKAAQRTEKRGPRRLNERYILRRDRLHLVLNLLESLPAHYKMQIHLNEDQPLEHQKENKGGQFVKDSEPKLAFKPSNIEGVNYDFLFQDYYHEMLVDMKQTSSKGNVIPKDWTLYYLRQKALTEKISIEAFAWVLLSYNQKRGYEKTEAVDKSTTDSQIVEQLDLKVLNVIEKKDKKGDVYFEVSLEGNDELIYHEYTKTTLTQIGDLKEITKISKLNEKGEILDKKTEYTVSDIYTLTIDKTDHELKDGKNVYTVFTKNGWHYTKTKSKVTNEYNDLNNKAFDYIVETTYNHDGSVKKTKDGEIYRTLREPDFSDASDDWTLLKKKTEKSAIAFNSKSSFMDAETKQIKKYVSPLIYDQLKRDAIKKSQTKIIGGMFQVVDRSFYREELNDIIKVQQGFHTSLKDEEVFENCVKLLYPRNKQHADGLLKNKKALQHLLVEDIILYQRPLKSKKSEIANCKYEFSQWKYVKDDKGNRIEDVNLETAEITYKKKYYYKKVVPVSHPIYQEFRIWDKIHNLKLIQIESEEDGKVSTNVDVTDKFFSTEIYNRLYDLMNESKSVTQKNILGLFKKDNLQQSNFRWNYTDDEELKGNTTRVSFTTRFNRCGFNDFSNFLTQNKEIELWHYLYSVSYRDRNANDKKSLKTFFKNYFDGYDIETEVFNKLIVDFSNYPQFQSKYGAFSEKALKKILPFLRIDDRISTDIDYGEQVMTLLNEIEYRSDKISIYLKSTNLNGSQKERLKNQAHLALFNHNIENRIKLILAKKSLIDYSAEVIDYSSAVDNNPEDGSLPLPKGLFEAFKGFEKPADFKNLNLTQACYLIYGRHSELSKAKYWISPTKIRKEIHQELKQHSLNNPVAEKVILETLQVVADIWEQIGDSQKNYFSKIHVEIGRSLKKSASEKSNLSENQKKNKVQNDRIRSVLEDHLSVSPYNANAKSSDHFERLKILENSAFKKNGNDKEYIKRISKATRITEAQFERYKLWVEQGYKSPYTDRIIKMSDLFDGNKYNIDHILPQASVTNNSLSNKIVCESEVNKQKSDQTGRDYILNPRSREVYCSAHGTKVQIIDDETYVSLVKSQFSGTKKFILLSKEVPKGFTDSQKNNMRHISRKAMELLSHIVREPGEIEFKSKHVLPVTGRITSELKKAWRLNEVWSELVSHRFKRMNDLTESNLFGDYQVSKSGHRYFDCKIDPLLKERDPDFNIKRIDHRHHALDALIVALCTEDHVNYINNYNSNSSSKNIAKERQIKKYRTTLKRKIKFTKNDENNDGKSSWYYMLPGEIRINNAQNSTMDSIAGKVYAFAKANPSKDYKQIFLKALEETIPSFKQNLRVINRTINYYQAYKDKNGNITKEKKQVRQRAENTGKKINWAVRRSLGKDTYYGRVNLKLIKKVALKSSLKKIYESPEIIVNKELRSTALELKNKLDLKFFLKVMMDLNPDNPQIETYYYTDQDEKTKKVASREVLNEKFNRSKIANVTDSGIRKILLNHLKKSDSVKLPFEEATKYPEALVEKDEFKAIIQSDDNDFKSWENLISWLKNNKLKYKKVDYKNLNVFVDQIDTRDFRNELNKNGKLKFEIDENPDLAFNSESITKMNEPKSLSELNVNSEGIPTPHHPIRKVRVSRGYGKQRALNPENKNSVKSKQFVVNDAGSNLYLGFYERTYTDKNGSQIKVRKFKDIGLIDLVEQLKQNKTNRHNPVADKVYDEDRNEYTRIFTLSPLDLVYVPTAEEMDNPTSVNFAKLDKSQIKRIYKYRDGGFNQAGFLQTNFIPCQFSSVFKVGEIEVDNKKIKGEITLTTAKDKQQKTLEYFHSDIDKKVMIREVCWKLSLNRIGRIIKVLR